MELKLLLGCLFGFFWWWLFDKICMVDDLQCGYWLLYMGV